MNLSYSKNTGNTLIETIFYIALFAALSIAVIDSLIVMTRSFKETTIVRDLIQGEKIVERISREVRGALSIDSIDSTSIVFKTKDDQGAEVVLGLNLSNGDVQFLKNNVFFDNLNTGDLEVTDLSFNKINTAVSEAVKMTLTVKSNKDPEAREESFYTTVVLRGKY